VTWYSLAGWLALIVLGFVLVFMVATGHLH